MSSCLIYMILERFKQKRPTGALTAENGRTCSSDRSQYPVFFFSLEKITAINACLFFRFPPPNLQIESWGGSHPSSLQIPFLRDLTSATYSAPDYPRPPHAPLIRLASWTSFCIIVTRLAWMAHRLVSSNRCTMNASAASWSACIAWLCQRKESPPTGRRERPISRT